MYLMPFDRKELLGFLEPGGEACEIGVYKGVFTAEILARAKPRRLHLIDPWQLVNDPAYQTQAQFLKGSDDPEGIFRGTCQRFAAEIESGQVVVHRGYAQDIKAEFAPGSFDWIYVDGDHTHEAVLRDLRDYLPLVKSDGLIFGHDFTEHSHAPAREMDFGVVSAMLQFMAESGCQAVALTLEVYATYVLTRNIDGPYTQAFLRRLLERGGSYVRIDPRQTALHYRSTTLSDGTGWTFPSLEPRAGA